MEKLMERYTQQQQKKKRLNAYDESKLCPIHYAARYNHYHMIQYLINNGASKNFYTPYYPGYKAMPLFPVQGHLAFWKNRVGCKL